MKRKKKSHTAVLKTHSLQHVPCISYKRQCMRPVQTTKLDMLPGCAICAIMRSDRYSRFLAHCVRGFSCPVLCRGRGIAAFPQ